MKMFQKFSRLLVLAAAAGLAIAPAVVTADSPKQFEAAKKLLAKGQHAKDFTLPAVGGELTGQVTFSEINKQGPVVIVVLRGFPGAQCPACSAQVGDFVKHADQFAAKNTRVLLIYPGSASRLDQHAEDFLQGTTLPKPITFLLDPGYKFTNTYGLRWDAPKETAYPSTLVVDESGVITFVKMSDTHRGRSTAAEVLAVIGD